MTKFRIQLSEERSVKGGVPQGSKVGSTAFIIYINNPPSSVLRGNEDEEDVGMFMDHTTISEIIDMSHHISGNVIGNSERNVDGVLQFSRDRSMELNVKKCR